jgi:hypothetical protein
VHMHATHKSIKVNIRLRTLDSKTKVWSSSGNTIFSTYGNSRTSFIGFTNAMADVSNLQVYNACMREDVQRFLGFENCTVFAYGQTGSGKTHTMLGNEEEGIIKLTLREILNVSPVTISYMEIYNEKLYDLSSNSEVQIFSTGHKNHISNLYEEFVTAWEEASGFIERCERNRRYGVTEFNDKSSRSHTVFQASMSDGTRTCRLNMIDLAGSERASRSMDRRREGSYINRSLLALCTVVNNMAQGRFTGFRDSKLTRMLQPSMDGTANLVAICMLSPHAECIEESISTLKFAARLSNLDLKCSTSKLQPLPEKGACCVCKGKKQPQGSPCTGGDVSAPSDMKPIPETEPHENRETQENRGGRAMTDKEKGGQGLPRCMNEFDEKLGLSCVRGASAADDALGGETGPLYVEEALRPADENTVLVQSCKEMVYSYEMPTSNIKQFKIVEDEPVSTKSSGMCGTSEERDAAMAELCNELRILTDINAMQQERISSLEAMVSDLLSKSPSKKISELFILEKHMYNLKRRMIDRK